MLEEKTAEYSTDVEACKVRISHLESMLAELKIRPDGSSNNALLLEAEDVDYAPPMVRVSVQVERDVVVEQVTAANLHALELLIANEELQRQLEVLRQNPFEVENQALQQEIEGLQHQLREANQHLADYNITKENMQKLQEENAKLKEYFWTLLKKRKGMRRNTLLATVRAC